MSEENLDFSPPPSGSDSDNSQEKGATRVDRGAGYNRAPTTGPAVFQVGSVVTTKDDATKASNSIDLAIIKKIEELIKQGRYDEAIKLAKKVKSISLEEKIKFAMQKGIIKPPSIQPNQAIKKINENGFTQSDNF